MSGYKDLLVSLAISGGILCKEDIHLAALLNELTGGGVILVAIFWLSFAYHISLECNLRHQYHVTKLVHNKVNSTIRYNHPNKQRDPIQCGHLT